MPVRRMESHLSDHPPSLMRKMGDKISSKQMAIEADVPIIPGVDHAVHGLEEVTKIANQVGYPVMLKASNGGGGRGMRIDHSAEEMPKMNMQKQEMNPRKHLETIRFSLKNT